MGVRSDLIPRKYGLSTAPRVTFELFVLRTMVTVSFRLHSLHHAKDSRFATGNLDGVQVLILKFPKTRSERVSRVLLQKASEGTLS